MNRFNTHRRDHKLEPILLYCSQATQTEADSESKADSESETEDSDFPPCRVGNSPPLIPNYSPATAPSRSCYPQAAASTLLQHQPTIIVSSEDEISPSQHHQQPKTGLARTNIIVDVTTTVLHTTKVIISYFLHVAIEC